ncbi:MAG: alpha-L-fucosidase [Anaerolineae bacterium]|nr:alpha-L-fucosidase [Anaerolineae bacterium]
MVPPALQWFVDGRFGMFIHWGVFSLLGKDVWCMYNEAIPPEEYARLADRFNPEHFDARAWAALAYEAGAKYVVLTTRNHDGFCIWDSKVSDFTSVKTAARRDFIADYVEAVRAYGLKVGFYYSLLDWRWPAYWNGPAADPQAWRELVRYAHEQVRELLTNYGKIDLLWWDGAWPYTATDWASWALCDMVRKLQPDIVFSDRSGIPGDFRTQYEHDLPWRDASARPVPPPWEACMTIHDSWGHSINDNNWKTPRQLVHALLRCVHHNGNLLLDVSPRPDGTIPEQQVTRMREIGAWLEKQGESLYGCGVPTVWTGRVHSAYYGTRGMWTGKGSTLYFHILRWSGNTLGLRAEGATIKSAELLLDGRRLDVEQNGKRVILRGLPDEAPDEIDTVVKCQVEPWTGEHPKPTLW